MIDNHPSQPSPSESDRGHLDAVQAEVHSILEAAIGRVEREQAAIDPVEVLNALHVPKDAGAYTEGLERVLRRIPDGWGRWIGCGAGWYPIVVRLADDVAALLPSYTIHQVKEKYGTLRFYWGTPYLEPSCCVAFQLCDPRPFEGAISGPWSPKDRDPEEQRLLEEWFTRYEHHIASDEHKKANETAYTSVGTERARETRALIDSLVDAAELESSRTCERCGSAGFLHEDHGWLRTLCSGCAAKSGYVPYR